MATYDVRIDYPKWSRWVHTTLRCHGQWPLPDPEATPKSSQFWDDNEFTRLFLLFNLPIEFIERSKTNGSDFTFARNIWTSVQSTYSKDENFTVSQIISGVDKDVPAFNVAQAAVYAEMAKMIKDSESFHVDRSESDSPIPQSFKISQMRVIPPEGQGYESIQDFVLRNYDQTCGDFKIDYFRQKIRKPESPPISDVELVSEAKRIFTAWKLDLKTHGRGPHMILLKIYGMEKPRDILNKVFESIVQNPGPERSLGNGGTSRTNDRFDVRPLNLLVRFSIGPTQASRVIRLGSILRRTNPSGQRFQPYFRTARHLPRPSGTLTGRAVVRCDTGSNARRNLQNSVTGGMPRRIPLTLRIPIRGRSSN